VNGHAHHHHHHRDLRDSGEHHRRHHQQKQRRQQRELTRSRSRSPPPPPPQQPPHAGGRSSYMGHGAMRLSASPESLSYSPAAAAPPPSPPPPTAPTEFPFFDPFTVAMEQLQARASARGDHVDHGGPSPAAVAAASAEQWVRRERDARAADADVTAGARSLHAAAAAAAERPSLSPMGRLSGGMSSWGAAAEPQQVCAWCPHSPGQGGRVGAPLRLAESRHTFTVG
jgi:hypothetical protein